MQKNITFPFLIFFISIVICSSFKTKADEYFSFSKAYNKALLNSNIIRSQGMTPQITAHYGELTWFRPWFHLVPHVCTNTKFQLTIVNWFGSGFGSTWFRMLAEAPNLSSLSGIDLVPLGSTSRQGPGNLSSHFWCKGSLGTKAYPS